MQLSNDGLMYEWTVYFLVNHNFREQNRKFSVFKTENYFQYWTKSNNQHVHSLE